MQYIRCTNGNDSLACCAQGLQTLSFKVVKILQKRQLWLPLLASAGIGTAAFYSMTRGQGMGQTVQQFIPLVTGLNGQGQQAQQAQQNNQQQQLSSGTQLH
jgi:hypothetical protein